MVLFFSVAILFLGPNFVNTSFLGKLQVFQTFPFCIPLTILTTNLAKISQQYAFYSMNAEQLWDFLH
jgi:hypothetical protein